MLTTSSEPSTQGSVFDPAELQLLLTRSLPEVRHIARRIHSRLPRHLPLDDLVHAGILGLIDAVHKFDPRKNVQLNSYARFRIRGAILDSLRQMDWGPRALRHAARRIDKANRELAAGLGRAPSEAELAVRLNLELREYQRLLGELCGLDLRSLQCPSEEGGAEENNLAVASRSEEDPFQLTFRAEVHALLAEAIEELNDKERQVLGLYYQQELTMKEVAANLAIGESRVSQIHTAALIQLRSRLQGRIGPGVNFQKTRNRANAFTGGA